MDGSDFNFSVNSESFARTPHCYNDFATSEH